MFRRFDSLAFVPDFGQGVISSGCHFLNEGLNNYSIF